MSPPSTNPSDLISSSGRSMRHASIAGSAQQQEVQARDRDLRMEEAARDQARTAGIYMTPKVRAEASPPTNLADLVVAVAPHGRRCIVTLEKAHFSLQKCHIVRRSIKDDESKVTVSPRVVDRPSISSN